MFAGARILQGPMGLSALVGWDTASGLFLLLTGWLMLRDDGPTVRARAADRDDTAPMISSLLLCAVAASLAAILIALGESKAGHGSGARPLAVALSVATLALSWLVIHVIFTLRYAHLYFGDCNADGAIDGGVEFPGEPPKDYRDFIYMAVCVGCTSQVSDFNITTSRFRSLVTGHALISFSFNVAVVALGINMVASILGQ